MIAASAGFNDAGGRTPLTAAGTAAPWVPVTFNGAGADLEPGAVSGSADGLVVAGITGDQVAVFAVSDWMAMPSIPRTDGARWPLLMIRTYFAGAWRGTRYGGLASGPNSMQANGRAPRGYLVSGATDNTESATAFATPTRSDHCTPIGVQFYSRRLGLTYLYLGDSHSQGFGDPANYLGWGWLAGSMLSRPDCPVSVVNAGWGGQSTAGIAARMRQEIDLWRPHAASYPIFSVNDGAATQANVDAAWRRAMEFVHYATSKGVVPILLTPPPRNAADAAQDALRMQNVLRARAMRDAGSVLLIDADEAFSDGATPARYLPRYNGDGVHTNWPGELHLAQTQALPALRAALAL